MVALPLPPPVEALLAQLATQDRVAAAVGVCARELERGVVPDSWEIATSAPLPELLARFPRAVVTAPDRLLLASAAGPVELHPLPPGTDVRTALGRRDFTLHALAVAPGGEWIDPYGGRADLAAKRLRATADPDARFAEDPLRALRAARLVAELGVALDAEGERAAQRVVERIERERPARVRSELARLLLAPHVEAGLRLLRRLGLEALFAEGVADESAAIVARLPRDLELRLAAWLRGARAVASLRAMRFPRTQVLRVERLLQMHPIEGGPAVPREQRIRRLARRHEADLRALLALREAEIAVRGEGDSAAQKLEPVRALAQHVLRGDHLAEHRAALALDGDAVMRHLQIGPGAMVGRALRHLAACVAQDPDKNTRETLLALLDQWAREAQARKEGTWNRSE
jgi:tRNA nucleotidyltransferase/poly(A) polymerase